MREDSATVTTPAPAASEDLGFVGSQSGKVWAGLREGLASGLSCPAAQVVSPGHQFTFHVSAPPSLDWIYLQTFRMQGDGCSCNLHPSRLKPSGRWSPLPNSLDRRPIAAPRCLLIGLTCVTGPSLNQSLWQRVGVGRTEWLRPSPPAPLFKLWLEPANVNEARSPVVKLGVCPRARCPFPTERGDQGRAPLAEGGAWSQGETEQELALLPIASSPEVPSPPVRHL